MNLLSILDSDVQKTGISHALHPNSSLNMIFLYFTHYSKKKVALNNHKVHINNITTVCPF